MKFLVISDIHGGLEDLIKVVKRYKSGEYKGLLILGDILYHGPRNPLPMGYDPKGVTELLNSISKDVTAIKGNCESEVDQMVLDFPVLASSNFHYIGDKRVFMHHGHGDYNYTNFLKEGDIVLSGHTHLYKIEMDQGIHILNPGSVSLPKGGNPKTFMEVDNNGVTLYDLESLKIIKESLL